MKCSVCSMVVKPVVAIDIDGTLADYHGHFADFAAVWLGLDDFAPDYDGSEPYNSWFQRAYGVDREVFRQIKLAYRQGGQKRSLPVYEHAVSLVNGARQLGAETWVTTTRPHERYDRVDPDTVEWLRRNGFQYDGLLYSEHKMEALAERVDPARVVFVLDDLTGTLERAGDLFPQAGTVLRLTQYNIHGPSWRVAVGDLLDARAMMAAHIEDFKIRHAFDNLPTTS